MEATLPRRRLYTVVMAAENSGGEGKINQAYLHSFLCMYMHVFLLLLIISHYYRMTTSLLHYHRDVIIWWHSLIFP
jgi:hypothetical protein